MSYTPFLQGPIGAAYLDQCVCSVSMLTFCRSASLTSTGCLLPLGIAPFTSCVRDTRRVLGGFQHERCSIYVIRKPMFPLAGQSAALCACLDLILIVTEWQCSAAAFGSASLFIVRYHRHMFLNPTVRLVHMVHGPPILSVKTAYERSLGHVPMAWAGVLYQTTLAIINK